MVPLGASVLEMPETSVRMLPSAVPAIEEAAVRVGLGHHRAEVAVSDGEPTGHGVVEGQVVALPVAHGCAAARP